MGLNEIIKIGDKIKTLRKIKNITQKDMAGKLKIPYSTYSNYENNNREPNSEILKKIANILNVNILELIGYDELEKQTFEEDFDINIFDSRVIKYINDLKQALKNNSPDVNINNTLIIQNIIINIMAKESAKSATGMFKNPTLLEFASSDGNLITGKELYEMLYKVYFDQYKKKRKELLRNEVDYIINYRLHNDLSSYEINVLKEFYEDYRDENIPREVFKILKENN